MKKLVFSFIAAVALVSVSNVFAGNKMTAAASVASVDTVAPADTTVQAPTDTTVQAPTNQPADTTTQAPTATTTSIAE